MWSQWGERRWKFTPGPIRDLIILNILGQTFNLSFLHLEMTWTADIISTTGFLLPNKTELQNLNPSSNVSSITTRWWAPTLQQKVPPSKVILPNWKQQTFGSNTEYGFSSCYWLGQKTSKFKYCVPLHTNNILRLSMLGWHGELLLPFSWLNGRNFSLWQVSHVAQVVLWVVVRRGIHNKVHAVKWLCN